MPKTTAARLGWAILISAVLGACGGAGSPNDKGGAPADDAGTTPSGEFVAVARFDGTSGQGSAPDTERFDGSASHAAQGSATLASCQWDFGDGSSPAEGCTLAHTFERAGQYQVTLTALASDGAEATAQLQVTVQAASERGAVAVAQLSRGSARGPAPLSVTLDASASHSQDAAAHVVSCTWDFGDGSPTAEGCSQPHTYARPGAFTATVTVVDSDGFKDAASLSLLVDAAAAISAVAQVVGDDHGPTPFTATLDGSGSHASDGSSDVHCAWSFGDGSPRQQGCAVTHTYEVSGSFKAVLTVTDATGASATAQVQLVSESSGGQTRWVQLVPQAFNAAVAANDTAVFAAFDDANGARIVSFNPQGQSVWSQREDGVAFDWMAASPLHLWASGAASGVYGGGVELRYAVDGQSRVQIGTAEEGAALIAVAASDNDDEADVHLTSDTADLQVHGHGGSSWVIHTSDQTPVEFQRVAFDPFGDVIACGKVRSAFSYQGKALEAGFTLFAFSDAGQLVWSVRLAADGTCSGLGTTAEGTIVAAITVDAKTTFGGDEIPAGSALIVLDAGGTPRWARALTPKADYQLAVEPHGEATLFGTTPTSSCASKATALKFNLAGSKLWTRTFAPKDCSQGQLFVQGIAQRGRDVVISGAFQGSVDFGTGAQQASDVTAFVVDLAP